jgi:hypothetical protein
MRLLFELIVQILFLLILVLLFVLLFAKGFLGQPAAPAVSVRQRRRGEMRQREWGTHGLFLFLGGLLGGRG